MKTYRYDMIGADLIYGVKSHPQDVMDRLGAKVVSSHGRKILRCINRTGH